MLVILQINCSVGNFAACGKEIKHVQEGSKGEDEPNGFVRELEKIKPSKKEDSPTNFVRSGEFSAETTQIS